MSDKETCATCKFYDGSPYTDGECRRHAPQLIQITRDVWTPIGEQGPSKVSGVTTHVLDYAAKYPPTSAHKYCGDYERKAGQ